MPWSISTTSGSRAAMLGVNDWAADAVTARPTGGQQSLMDKGSADIRDEIRLGEVGAIRDRAGDLQWRSRQ
jgi:hypothetical protein